MQTVALLEGSTLAHRAILAHSAILAHRAMLAHVKAQIADSSTPAFDKSPFNSVPCFDSYSNVSGCLNQMRQMQVFSWAMTRIRS